MRLSIIFIVLFITPLPAKSEVFKLESLAAQEKQYFKQELNVELNLHNGKVLVLNDGSIWEVAPQDLSTSQSWILPSPLNIEKSNNSAYPYKMVNTVSNSSILVRPIPQ